MCPSPSTERMRQAGRPVWGMLAILLVVWAPAPARAQAEPEDASEAARAEQAWHRGRFSDAARLSLQAYRRAPNQALHLYNAARAFHRARWCADAHRYYRTYLDLAAPDAERRDLAGQMAEAIRSGVDPDCRGPTSRPVDLARAATPSDRAAPRGSKPRAMAPLRTESPTAVAAARIPSLEAAARARKVWGWTLVGSSGVALLTGGYLLADALATLEDLEDASPLDPKARAERDSALRKRDAGLLGAGIGAVAGTLGLWLLLHDDPPPTIAEGLAQPGVFLQRAFALRPMGTRGGILTLRLGF